ncbi:hypothetical protein [Ruegeria sp. Ofav3-42]|uniref:hypothetical protein n=1 Tax=Ruegeria sp. Ofav3-42 TaxID=2917759 RepID=UPI001EF751FF|nr:hypothetical protein [Ruegeria sp. Ofav3-42]MCG7519730.1 hypothetical protein [Ruegeria sp. Ofav3-42]
MEGNKRRLPGCHANFGKAIDFLRQLMQPPTFWLHAGCHFTEVKVLPHVSVTNVPIDGDRLARVNLTLGDHMVKLG